MIIYLIYIDILQDVSLPEFESLLYIVAGLHFICRKDRKNVSLLCCNIGIRCIMVFLNPRPILPVYVLCIDTYMPYVFPIANTLPIPDRNIFM